MQEPERREHEARRRRSQGKHEQRPVRLQVITYERARHRVAAQGKEGDPHGGGTHHRRHRRHPDDARVQCEHEADAQRHQHRRPAK